MYKCSDCLWAGKLSDCEYEMGIGYICPECCSTAVSEDTCEELVDKVCNSYHKVFDSFLDWAACELVAAAETSDLKRRECLGVYVKWIAAGSGQDVKQMLNLIRNRSLKLLKEAPCYDNAN